MNNEIKIKMMMMIETRAMTCNYDAAGFDVILVVLIMKM